MHTSKGIIYCVIFALTASLFASCKESGTGPEQQNPGLVVKSVNPIKGKYDTEITVSGEGFSEKPSENKLNINGIEAVVTSSSPTSLTSVIPKGAGSGPVTVQVKGETAEGPTFHYIPTVNVTTFAGSGQLGYRDGEKGQARFNYPVGLELTSGGELVVVDHWNHCVRIIKHDETVSTLAGTCGSGGLGDGFGTNARFFRPIDVEVADDGVLYISDFGNHRIRQIEPSSLVRTLSGTTQGYRNGLPQEAQFNYPAGIAQGADGQLYIGDSGNNRIRRVTTNGEVFTYAGSGRRGAENGYGEMAEFYFPFGMDLDKKGRIFIADYGNNSIRLISSDIVVSTFSGGGESGYVNENGEDARYSSPYDVAVDSNEMIYVADFYNHRIRRIAPDRSVIDIAGTGEPGLVNGDETEAQFDSPIGLAVNEDGTVLYVADHHNHVIRKVTIE